MACELCGGGDGWLKTCLTPYGTRLRVCDLCYEEHASELVIVPGDSVVTARCDECWSYGNPREFAEVHPGGRKDVYSGVCGACAKEREERRRIQRRVHTSMCGKNNQCNCGGCVFRPRREPMSNKDGCLLSIVLYALPTLFLVMFFAQGC